nr:tyrosine-type recombinase/integrase [Roseovarius salinarum]
MDDFWYHLRIQDNDLPGKHILRTKVVGAYPSATACASSPATVTLSEAIGIYVRLKGHGRPASFREFAERFCGYVIDVCGDKDIMSYTKADANAVRDALIERQLAGSTIARVLGAVRAVINFAASEIGVEMVNPFGKVYYDRTAGTSERKPLPLDTIRQLQAASRELDDEVRWLLALVSDTGMRLAEAAGLLREDLRVDAPIPHVVIQEHPWRRLKTKGSARTVPLVGASYWAANRVLAHETGSEFAFPRYNTDEATKANAASTALNKWMKSFVPAGCTLHSFRHSMRDRLRGVECPADIVDQIGGWQTEGVGQSYGKGYPLQVLAKWMQAAA